MKKLGLMMVFTIFASYAFAETYNYAGVLVKQGGYLGIQTEQFGFIALDESSLNEQQAIEVQTCLNKNVQAEVENRGMISDLISLSCK